MNLDEWIQIGLLCVAVFGLFSTPVGVVAWFFIRRILSKLDEMIGAISELNLHLERTVTDLNNKTDINRLAIDTAKGEIDRLRTHSHDTAQRVQELLSKVELIKTLLDRLKEIEDEQRVIREYLHDVRDSANGFFQFASEVKGWDMPGSLKIRTRKQILEDLAK